MALEKKRLTIVVVVIAVSLVTAFFAPNVVLPNNAKSGEWVGLCAHFLGMNEAAMANASGARWVRLDVSHSFASSIINAKFYKLNVLGILDSAMFNDSTTFNLEQWRSNVTFYVSQYANSVDAWEIWNEPTTPVENWALLGLKLQDGSGIIQENLTRIVNFYFSMVQIAEPIIRQYDPTAKILLCGGLNLNSGNSWNLKIDESFAEQLAAKNITQFGDGFSVHAYPWGNQTGQKLWQQYSESLAFYRSVFCSDRPLEVWVTETGQNIEDSNIQLQAQYLSDAYGFFHGKVNEVFWYLLKDNIQEKSFGLIQNGTTRPAYQELQKAIAKL